MFAFPCVLPPEIHKHCYYGIISGKVNTISVKISQDMDRNDDLARSPDVIKRVTDKASWFDEHAYRWPSTALPVAYALACVEVACKSSEKAGGLFQQIIEACGKPGIKAVIEKIISNEEKEELKQMLKGWKAEFAGDVNKPFKALEEIGSDNDLINAFLKAKAGTFSVSQEEEKDWARLIRLIRKFTLAGFNRKSDIRKGKYRVEPTEKPPWLLIAVIYRALFQYMAFSPEMLNRTFKRRMVKGKTYDLEKVMTQQRPSRMYRNLVANAKKAGMLLKNDKTIMKAARRWYQCRVVYPSVNEFCVAESRKEIIIILDPKNVDKEIRPCDEALAYQGRRRTQSV